MNDQQPYSGLETIAFFQRFSFKSLLGKFNFEFMDLDIIPNSLKYVLRDILDVGCNAPFRRYNQWVANCIYEYAQKNHIKEIVELGAGSAPITRFLIKKYPHWNIKFTITDINPDIKQFKKLSETDSRIKSIFVPFDFAKKMPEFKNSLLVLSAAFHHVPESNKKNILMGLKSVSPHVLIFEPVCPNAFSLLLNLGILFTGPSTPFFLLTSKSFFRSIFWCWAFPIAPFLLLWDGTISTFRCWSKKKWHSLESKAIIEEHPTCLKIQLHR